MIALVERTLTRLADTKMPSKSVAFISFLRLSRNVEIIKNFSCARECERAAIKKEFFSFVMAKALKFISLIKFYFMEVRGGLGNIFLWENSNFKFFYWSWHNFWYATSIKKRGFNVITKLFFPSFVEKLFSISLNHDGWWCKIFTHISAIQNRRCFFHRNFFLLIVISLIVPIIIKINNDVTLLHVRLHVEFSWYGTWKYFLYCMTNWGVT